MKNHILINIAVIVILLSSIFVSCAKPAEFTVVDLSLEPAEIVAGASSTASARVSNTGGTEGTYSAVLVINSEKSETKSVLINPGGTEVVTFTVSRPTPGRYEVAIGSQKQTLTVKLSTAKEIVANAVVASATWDTCKYDMDMSTLMEVVGGTQSGKVAMTVAGTAIMDNTRKEMQIVMNMKIGASGQMNLATKTELYAVGGWMYMNVGGLWMKSRLTDQLWQSQQSQLYQQTEFLRTAVDVKLLGTDNLSGTLCHTVEITPNLGALTDWLSKQQTEGTTGPDFGKLNLNEVIKKMSIKEGMDS